MRRSLPVAALLVALAVLGLAAPALARLCHPGEPCVTEVAKPPCHGAGLTGAEHSCCLASSAAEPATAPVPPASAGVTPAPPGATAFTVALAPAVAPAPSPPPPRDRLALHAVFRI